MATEVTEAAGLVPAEFSPSVQPLTGFIVDPSALSFVVAFLSGMAGTLSLTEARAGALIGVLISVTTIPAVAPIGRLARPAELGRHRLPRRARPACLGCRALYVRTFLDRVPTSPTRTSHHDPDRRTAVVEEDNNAMARVELQPGEQVLKQPLPPPRTSFHPGLVSRNG